MPYIKATMLCELATNTSGAQRGRRIAGWSESVTDFNSVSLAQRDLIALCQARAGLMPIGVRVVGQRYQVISPIGPSISTARQFPGTLQTTCDLPQVSVLARIGTSASPNTRNIIIRGIPDGAVVEGEYLDGVIPAANWTNYARALNGYLFSGRVLTANQQTIDHIDANGAVVLTEALTVTAGTYVRVLRSLNDNGRRVGGRFRVGTVASPMTFQLERYDLGLVNGGKMRIDEQAYFSIAQDTFGIVRAITRKAGRPFGQFSGKVSARR